MYRDIDPRSIVCGGIFDEESNASDALTKIQLRQEVLDGAKASFKGILSARKHRGCPRVVALLRPLARHADLRQLTLTPGVLRVFTGLLGCILSHPGENFAQAVDGLGCLLNCSAFVYILCVHVLMLSKISYAAL